MLPVFIASLIYVHERLHAVVMFVDDLLVVLNVLHAVLVARVYVDSWVINLVKFIVFIIEVAL